MKQIKFKFYPQIGKEPKLKGEGVLSFDKKEACFFEGDGEFNSKILVLR